jgi:hypothetical protein
MAALLASTVELSVLAVNPEMVRVEPPIVGTGGSAKATALIARTGAQTAAAAAIREAGLRRRFALSRGVTLI